MSGTLGLAPGRAAARGARHTEGQQVPRPEGPALTATRAAGGAASAEAPRPGLSMESPRLLPAGLRPRDSLASGGAGGVWTGSEGCGGPGSPGPSAVQKLVSAWVQEGRPSSWLAPWG